MMTLSVISSPDQIKAALAAPFPADVVQSRPGPKTKDGKKAIAFFYIDARAIMDRLDQVLGIFGWKDSYEIALDRNLVICRLSARLSNEWVTKEDVGVHSPNHDQKSTEENLDKDYKGVFSNAFKRAAVKWGIGRYLYDVPQIWHPLAEGGRFFDSKNPPVLPRQFLPGTDDPIAISKKSADWIVHQLAEATTLEAIGKVDAIVKERGAARLLTVPDGDRVDAAFKAAEERARSATHP